MSFLNGLLDLISRALQDTLQFFYGFAHDYTLAIVLLTLAVKLLALSIRSGFAIGGGTVPLVEHG